MTAKIGNILVDSGKITARQLATAQQRHDDSGEPLTKALVSLGFIADRELLQILAVEYGLPVVDLRQLEISDEAIKRVPAKFVRHYNAMPTHLHGRTLTVAVSDVEDSWLVEDLESHLGLRVERTLALPGDIQAAIEKYYGVAAETIERIMATEAAADEEIQLFTPESVEDLEQMADTASVIRVVNQILHQAIDQRATDIHLETFRDEARLRYRVDGILRDAQISDDIKYLYPAIISRIKIMSRLDIIERRLPQDGRAKAKIGQREYDLRISVMPTIHGENIVVRILPTTMMFSLSDLGMLPPDLKQIDALIGNSNGIVFVTGPTGSGKSTTLYAALKKLNDRQRKLVTIEDPVEYELKGVSQVQVRPKIGLTFAIALRSMLRHDPDVIMVGEIRDQETASIAIRAALTGHLVLSTLHTNDAASGITRLLDIGIEPYLVASSVRAFVAQRLVRVLCPDCKRAVPLSADARRQLGQEKLENDQQVMIYETVGCDSCDFSGYRGRTGIYEVLLINEEIRGMIADKMSADVIKRRAVALGMRTLKDDGFDKIRQGITTPDEVMRVTQLQE